MKYTEVQEGVVLRSYTLNGATSHDNTGSTNNGFEGYFTNGDQDTITETPKDSKEAEVVSTKEGGLVSVESEMEAIVPGSKEDPFKSYRWIKQICLVLVWICIVRLSLLRDKHDSGSVFLLLSLNYLFMPLLFVFAGVWCGVFFSIIIFLSQMQVAFKLGS